MDKVTRRELDVMSDDDLLAYERRVHDNPYMTLATAQEMRKLSLHYWHLRGTS
jgi:hypothetical protein